ncbi:MAG TPA: hypothetical protein VLQ93_09095 [Myxococcaceae bacterium]|nr:hypothetical protein [Myxococcaceae bacterium]
MAGKYRDTTTPGRGYTPAVSRSRGLTDKAGRGVPDERRTFEEQREEGHFAGRANTEETLTGRASSYGADPYNPPTGSESARATESSTADVESDEAPSGRIQGG